MSICYLLEDSHMTARDGSTARKTPGYEMMFTILRHRDIDKDVISESICQISAAQVAR